MSESGLVRGELLGPEGLRRGSVLGRPVVLLELLVQGEIRVARVIPYLHQLQIRDDSAIIVRGMGIYDLSVRGRP